MPNLSPRCTPHLLTHTLSHVQLANPHKMSYSITKPGSSWHHVDNDGRWTSKVLHEKQTSCCSNGSHWLHHQHHIDRSTVFVRSASVHLRLTHGSMVPREFSLQTTSWMVQSLLQGSPVRLTQRHTDINYGMFAAKPLPCTNHSHICAALTQKMWCSLRSTKNKSNVVLWPTYRISLKQSFTACMHVLNLQDKKIIKTYTANNS